MWGQGRQADGGLDQGLAEEMKCLDFRYIFKVELMKLAGWIWRARGIKDYEVWPEHLEECGCHNPDVKDYGRSRFGRGIRSLHWGMLHLRGIVEG